MEGILDVQLIAEGATAEDMKSYPARISKQGDHLVLCPVYLSTWSS